MLQDMVDHPPGQLPNEEISSPISAQIFDFCESELFPETIQNSEVASNSNCCNEEHSSYTTPGLTLTPEINKLSCNTDTSGGSPKAATTPNATNTPTSTITSNSNFSPNTPSITTNNNNNLSVIFDSSEEIENDISASIDFTTSPTFSVPQYVSNQPEQFDISSLQRQDQVQVTDLVDGSALAPYPPDSVVPLMGPILPPVYENECLSSVHSYVRYLDPTVAAYLPNNLNAPLPAENAAIFSGNLFLGPEIPSQDVEYQGENTGIFYTETMPRLNNFSELQVLNNDNQNLANGEGKTPLASEITSLEESSFKAAGKLSVEQRKEKIHRYMKKRNERNFSKKIKYACRKTLADSRPRVRGRFAKNDEFTDAPRSITCSSHEEDTDEDVRSVSYMAFNQVVVKEEGDMVDSSDIFAHISGVNSFKCNYPIQSWI